MRCCRALLVLGQLAGSVARAGAQEDFSGIRTFLKASLVDCSADFSADIAVLGVPLDEGTTARPGARYAPREIRDASFAYAWAREGGFYYIDEARTVLAGKRWVDCGDVPIAPTRPGRTGDRVTAAVQAIRRRGAIPVILGGDHSISFPVLRALTVPALTLIHLDAHTDNYPSGPDNLDHGTWLHRAASLPQVKRVVQIGMRGLANGPQGVELARQMGSTVITSEAIHRNGVGQALAKIPHSRAIYVTIDIDVVDPALAPGTGTPEVGGLTFQELHDLLIGIGTKGDTLLGMDVVEVNPYYDATGITAQLAARIVIDLLGAAIRP
jgi:agmatinase